MYPLVQHNYKYAHFYVVKIPKKIFFFPLPKNISNEKRLPPIIALVRQKPLIKIGAGGGGGMGKNCT